MESEDRYLSRKDAAAYLGVGLRTLDRYRAEGYVESTQIGGLVRFKRSWLDHVLEANRRSRQTLRTAASIQG